MSRDEQSMKKSQADGALEKSNQLGIRVDVLSSRQPVLKAAAGDVVVPAILSLARSSFARIEVDDIVDLFVPSPLFSPLFQIFRNQYVFPMRISS